MASRQFCTFRLGDLYLGIEVLEVQEVLRSQEATRVPLASDDIWGLINLRGRIVVAIDLRVRLGLPPRQGGRRPMNVVLKTEGGGVSLLVDRIGDVVHVDDSMLEPTPDSLDDSIRDFIAGVYMLDGSLLLVLDTDKTADFDAGATVYSQTR